MLLLIFSLVFPLAILITTTATPHDEVPISEKPISTDVFGALGTIIGYLGTEITSDSLFERLLWPTRFYNTLNPIRLFKITVFTPMGGPLLKPAVRVFDEFMTARMHKGKRQGDPLGTAFYSNLGRRYKIHAKAGFEDSCAGEDREFRNCIRIRVLRLVGSVDGQDRKGDAEAPDCTKPVSAQRPVYLLDLTPFEYTVKIRGAKENVSVISNDTGTPGVRNIICIILSELIASCIGISVGIKFQSTYAILFFLPLILKVLSLMFTVRRQSLVWPKPPATKVASKATSKDKTQLLELDREHDTDDFVLIRGSQSLLGQSSRHYGHRLCDNHGFIANDRRNEVVTMLLVLTFAMFFPISLFASIWASEEAQRWWLGYEAFAIASMYAFRFMEKGWLGVRKVCWRTSWRKGGR